MTANRCLQKGGTIFIISKRKNMIQMYTVFPKLFLLFNISKRQFIDLASIAKNNPDYWILLLQKTKCWAPKNLVVGSRNLSGRLEKT